MRAGTIGVFLFCAFRVYYNSVEVVPSWLNDIYFVVESALVVLFIYSSKLDRGIKEIGLAASIGSFLYFLLQYMDILQYDSLGAKYFVPTFVILGILIAGYRWRHFL
jgi:hypothetical protein